MFSCVQSATLITSVILQGHVASSLHTFSPYLPNGYSNRSEERRIPFKIVQVGDSYNAGLGGRNRLGRADYVAPVGCRRGQSSWGQIYAEWFQAKYDVTFLQRACTGAFVNDLLRPKKLFTTVPIRCPPQRVPDEYYVQQTEPTLECTRYLYPQLDSVDETVDLVIVMIGGNDLQFGRWLEGCFAPVNVNASTCLDAKSRTLYRLRGDFPDRLRNMYRVLRDRLTPSGGTLPRGRALHVFYPYLVTSRDYIITDGPGSNVTINISRELRSIQDEMEQVYSDAIRDINQETGIDFITFWNQTTELFAGHEVDPRIGIRNPLRWINEWEGPRYIESFHPNQYGHRALGRALARQGTFGAKGGASLLAALAARYGSQNMAENNSSASLVPWSTPKAWIPEALSGQIGVPMLLDASGSYDPRGVSLVRFDWDINDDGLVDRVTLAPKLWYKWASSYQGSVSVRVTNRNGLISPPAKAYVDVNELGYTQQGNDETPCRHCISHRASNSELCEGPPVLEFTTDGQLVGCTDSSVIG